MEEFDQLVKVVKILRSPDGCPWDRAQTMADMKKYLLEETYELIDALSDKDYKAAEEELGDVTLIIIVIAEMLDKEGKANLKKILQLVKDKMVLRHPHVFSENKLGTKEEVLKAWVDKKANDKNRKSVKDRLPKMAPALLLSYLFLKEYKVLGKKVNDLEDFEDIALTISAKLDKLKKEKKEGEKGPLISEILFYVTKLSFIYGLDPEELLRQKIFREAEKVSYGKDR
jgi:tetrapyrrole methylase family protein/MazG family protein